MRRLIFSVLVLALGGCASAPARIDYQPYLHDAAFGPPALAPRVEDIFQSSPEMRRYLDTQVAAQIRRHGPRQGLFNALRNDLKIEYDTEWTRTAQQAFAARAGNCLSLVVLTAALAKQLDIPVQYQLVSGEDTWSRTSEVTLRNGHVNVVLGTRQSGYRPASDASPPMVIDFLPAARASRLVTRPVAEETVLAMFLNNRAVELLTQKDLNSAYWWARAAVRASPSYLSAYNTLGVLYRRQGLLAQAEAVLRFAHAREPGNASVLSNLQLVVSAQGRRDEAARLRRQLAELATYPPFHFMDQGMVALKRDENEAALRLFERELKRMPYDDQLHFLIAVAHLREGDVRGARSHLQQARDNSTTRSQQALYSAKLEHLNRMSLN